MANQQDQTRDFDKRNQEGHGQPGGHNQNQNRGRHQPAQHQGGQNQGGQDRQDQGNRQRDVEAENIGDGTDSGGTGYREQQFPGQGRGKAQGQDGNRGNNDSPENKSRNR